LSSTIRGHARSTVSRVANIAHVVNDQGHDGARSTSVDVADFILLTLGEFQEQLFSLFESILDRLDWFFREVRVLNDELMQIVPEKVSTHMASMPVIDSKE